MDISRCNGTNDSELSSDVRAHIEHLKQTAFEFFERVLQLYKAKELMFSFNGGKDCTVLLDLFIKFCEKNCISHRHIPLLYIKSDNAFAEMDEFVDQCVQHYNIQLIKYKGSLKEALTRMCADMPAIKAVFLGSRNTDPYCDQLVEMQPTDNGWPPLMRLSPILEWSYHDVWNYIRIYKVPYCRLYDYGYTSLGNRLNTIPNPHLRIMPSKCSQEGVGVVYGYRPAYELTDGTLEREGRISKKQQQQQPQQ